jgi:putative transposase
MNRSSWYYEAVGESAENLALMRRMDEQYLKKPCYGSRKMAEVLGIDRKRAQRLMRLMGLEAIYPKPRLSQNGKEHRIYPYLLRNVKIVRPNQVWSSDITYVPMPQGWMYLTVVMDWFSRCVLSWRLSNTLDGLFCLEALEEALGGGTPEIFNTDQGVQYTSADFTRTLLAADVRISMNGAGRCFDNIMVERLWRTVKQEEVYLKEYEDVLDCRDLGAYFEYYDPTASRRWTPGRGDLLRRIERKKFFAAMGLTPDPGFLRHSKSVLRR